MPTGVNILLDCVVSMKFSASDLGGGETYAGSITFKVDKVTVNQNIASSDHSTGQDEVEFHRKDKLGWEITVETKHGDATIFAALLANALGELIVTAPTGLGISSAKGLITALPVDFDKPSTMKFSLKSRGIKITWA